MRTSWLIAAYLCLSGAILYLLRPWFAYPAFFCWGPLCVGPSETLSLCMRVLWCALAACGGLAYVVGRSCDSAFLGVLLGAALSVFSAIAGYLLCYTLLNAVFRICFLIAAAGVAAFVALGRKARTAGGEAWSVSAGLVNPVLWFMACAGFVTCTFSGWALNAYSYELAQDQSDRTLAANIDSVVAFYNGEFERQSLAARADSVGAIVLVEANYLGVQGPITISVEACKGPSSVSYYDAADNRNRLVFSPAYLMTQDGGYFVEAAAHEMAHVFQYQCCTGEIPPDAVTGWPGGFPERATLVAWAAELSDYTSAPSGDVEGYFAQSVEQTAYAFGLQSAADIEARVERYLATGDAGP